MKSFRQRACGGRSAPQSKFRTPSRALISRKLLRLRELKFYAYLDRSKCSLWERIFSARERHWGATPPTVYFGPPNISATVRGRKLKFYTHIDRPSTLFEHKNFRQGACDGCSAPTVNLGTPLLHQQWDPGSAHKYPQTSDPFCPFYTAAKCAKFCPKLRPQSSSDRRNFGPARFIGKQTKKQNCQGPTIGLPPYHTWIGWVPPTPRTVGDVGTPKCKTWKISYISTVSAAHADYSATNVIPPVGGIAVVKTPPCDIFQFAPYSSQGVSQKSKSGNFFIYPPFYWPTTSTAPPMLYHLLGPQLL